MTTIQTDLGLFVRNGNEWTASRKVTVFGTLFDTDIIIEGNDQYATVVKEQLDALTYYSVNEQKLLAAAEHAIQEHYWEVVCDGNRKNECAFETMLELTGIVFPMVIKRESRTIGLLLECNWDQENGLAVVFDDDMIEVGTQDLLT